MTDYPMLPLNDDRRMPQLGFGTWQIDNDRAAEAVKTAIETGYRLIDTAWIYRNEQGVGTGLGGADRGDVWLTTKVWNDYQGHTSALQAIDKSLALLGRDSVDLVLIHWPCPDRKLAVDTWKALIEARDAGKTGSIGVSNFREEDLNEIVQATGVVPVVNQIELHPAFQQRRLRSVHDEMGIVTQSWSPLGQGGSMENSVIAEISEEVGQPAAAVILRWHIQHGLSPIPKATGRAHIEENFAALGFALDDDQMARIDALDRADGRIGPDPAEFS